MAPSKTPAFAVCGGVSVEIAVTGVGRRRSSGKAMRRNAVAGLAESLYADLLWDCGGANVENATAAVGTASSSQAFPEEDFADVFGGPPKFASVSAQLSFRRGMTRVSDACSKEGLLLESSASTPAAFDISSDQTPLHIARATLENSTASPSSAKSVKIRSKPEADFSSRICYSDSEKKSSLLHKGDIAFSRKEVSSTIPSGASSRASMASTSVKRRESSRFDAGEDAKDTSLSKASMKDFTSIKENIEGFPKGLASDREDKFGNVHERMASSLKGSHESKQKLGRTGLQAKAHRQSHTSKVKKEDLWLTIKDIQFATEPSRFPPPSRPPPELKSDASFSFRNPYGATSSIDDPQNGSGLPLPKHSLFESGEAESSSCSQDLNAKATSDSRVIEDAVEIAEAKIRMVLEAREKAKLMVERKVREKQRAQQLKEKSITDGKPGAERELKGHMKGEKRNIKVRSGKFDVNKLGAERMRPRDIARQSIEKTTRDFQKEFSVSSIQERVAELRFSHNVLDRPVEMRKEYNTAKVDENQSDPSSHIWTETSGGYQKQSSCEDACVDEVILAQQQDSVSRSWWSTEHKDCNEFSSLDESTSMSSAHKTVVLPHGDDPSLIGFQEIMGETVERRMARWERFCRTTARMAKALEEKKQCDLERQMEQAERHRAAEMVDEMIKIWAAGKEGNLEALLCSLHLVLWPECGWKGVSPAELSTTAAVRKAYRRATLCVHPDKMQQRGATVTQRYIAEKVFDLLREALGKYM